MKKSEYIDRVAIREKVCTGCTMLVDGVCRDADPCEKLIAGFLEEPLADVVPAHLKEWERNDPLTLDELVDLGFKAECGENIIVYCTPLNDWAKLFKYGLMFFGTEDYQSWPEIEKDYGKTWLAYRQKPEEGTV